MRSCLFASLLAGMLLCWLMPGPAAAEGLLELSRDVPPRKLADAAEVIVVSGYKPDMEDQMGAVARVTVTVDRPGARVLLVLTSCKVVHWQVKATEGTTLAGILVSGYETPIVSADVHVPAFRVHLPCVRETENKNFVVILTQLDRLFGVTKVDAFRASDTIPAKITISDLDVPRPELTLSGPEAEQPASNFTFYLATSQYRRVPWTLSGPVVKADSRAQGYLYASSGPLELSFSSDRMWALSSDGRLVLAETAIAAMNVPRTLSGPVVNADSRVRNLAQAGSGPLELSLSYGRMWTLSPDGRTLYILRNEQLNIQNLEGEASTTTVKFPPNFPRFPWVGGMAYDSKRDIVCMVSSGGTGHLYRYSVKEGNWLDFRWHRVVNLHFLAYDPAMDRYIGWAEDQLVFISGEGEFLFVQKIADKLPGFGRLHQQGDVPSLALAVYPHGDELALVAFSVTGRLSPDNPDDSGVLAIWLYNVQTEQAVLTYKTQP